MKRLIVAAATVECQRLCCHSVFETIQQDPTRLCHSVSIGVGPLSRQYEKFSRSDAVTSLRKRRDGRP